MRLLIVVPRYIEKPGDLYEFPLGLAYISASLKQNGFKVHCLNLNHSWKDVRSILTKEILGKSIDVFLTGGLSGQYNKIKPLFNYAKDIKPDITTIVGGGILSADPRFVMQLLKADIGVIGEGEETIVELANNLSSNSSIDKVRGIIFKRRTNELVVTQARPLIENIDHLPIPDYEGFGVQEYLNRQKPGDRIYTYQFDSPRVLNIISSRSCPFQCTFCFHPLGNRYRRRSLESFFNELKYLKDKFQINTLHILDELFSLDSSQLEWFAERMKAFDLKWMTSFRVTDVNDYKLSVLKASGLFYLSYGLESASDTILNSMKKRTTIADIEKALEVTKNNGIGIQGIFIFGDPAETLETANQTLQWWQDNYQYQIDMSPVIPYPGSKIFYYAIENKIIADKKDYLEKNCPPINLTGMSDEEYGTIFGKISELQYQFKMKAKEVRAVRDGWDSERNTPQYILEAECPHCNEQNRYQNFERNSYGFFKIGCRSCNQRFQISSMVFSHIREKYLPIQTNLNRLITENTPVSMTPSINGFLLSEFMNFLGIDFKNLNLKYLLDMNPRDYKTAYLDRFFSNFEVLPRTKKIIETKCTDHCFILLPANKMDEILIQMRDEFQIPIHRLVVLGEEHTHS